MFLKQLNDIIYNNYSETRNLIGQYPCRMRQFVPLYIEGNLSKVNDVNHRIYMHAPHAIVNETTTNTIRMLRGYLPTSYHNSLRCPIQLSCPPLFSVF